MRQVLDVIRQGFSLKISLFWDIKWYGFESRKVKGFLHSQNQNLGLGERLILEKTDGCWKPLRTSPLWHDLGEVCIDVYVCLYKNQWASYPRGSNTRIPGPLWHGMSAVQGNTWRTGLPLSGLHTELAATGPHHWSIIVQWTTRPAQAPEFPNVSDSMPPAQHQVKLPRG